ncbi:hypothetical protein ID866_11007 [Astraeus odoratus]|nr:hypothetical protein ID866_11007 [Astraeus odoratus]
MRDSNWRKLVNIVASLLKKYKTAHRSLKEKNVRGLPAVDCSFRSYKGGSMGVGCF